MGSLSHLYICRVSFSTVHWIYMYSGRVPHWTCWCCHVFPLHKCASREQQEPTGHCSSCGFLCDTSSSRHLETKEFFPLAQSVPSIPNVLKCPRHPTEKLYLYCETCKEVICHDCIIRLHRDHQYDLVTDAFPHNRREC